MAAVIAMVLVGGVATVLVRSQTNAASTLEVEFGRRAALAAHLTAGALSSNATQYPAVFSGPASRVPEQMATYESTQPDHRAAVIDARGRLLGAWPPRVTAATRRFAASPLAREAQGVAGPLLSDLAFWGTERVPVVTLASRFDTPQGRRVFIATVDAAVLETFASAYLASAPGVRGARAYLIDGRGRIIASSEGLRQGAALPDRELLGALRSRSDGDLGRSRFTSASMPNSHWKVVFLASRSALLAPIQGATRRSSWVLFVVFTLALAALLRVGLAALRQSSQLVEAREREHAAERLAHERLHDALTGLPNRVLFLDRTERALSIARAAGRPVTVMRMGLDRFTRINDSLGHAAGDELLVLVAQRLRRALRPELTVSRFGGDGFLVLCDDAETTIEATGFATTVQSAIGEPLTIAGRVVHLSCGVGIAMQVPGAPPVTADAMVRDADTAMHQAKTQGQNQVRVCHAELHAHALDLLDTEAALRTAISAGELVVHYQPIVTLADGQLRGVEALVRWQRPGVGLVAPPQFIGVAEESGLICNVGRVVLETATAHVAQWAAEGLLTEDFALSVNVSAHQLDDERLVNLVAEVLTSWPLAPSALWLEITETAVARDPEAAHRTLTSLHTLGVRVALDDFGTGHTSLEQLARTLPVDILKLDRSFVGHMENARDHAVVAAMPSMASGLGMLVIAEGAENAGQAQTLTELGYTHAQGFNFGRPMAAERLAVRLAEAKAASATA